MNTLTDIVSDALVAGGEQRPAMLIQLLEGLKRPTEVLTSLDLPHELFDALAADAPGYEKLRSAPETITDTERSGLQRLLRWAVRELSTWSAAVDSGGTVLEAVSLALQMLGFRAEHWNSLPAGIANAEVRDRIAKLLKNVVISMSVEPRRGHAYEQKIVDKVKHADEQENWVELAENWRFIADFLHPSLLLSQGVLYLARYYPDALRDVVAQQSQTSVAWLVAKQLPVHFRLHLASESHSRRFQFAALLSVSWSDLKNRQLSQNAVLELTQLLVQVAQNPAEWRTWMKVFNEHPARFPWLQISLGKALAQASEEAMRGYVDAISLYPWPFGNPSPAWQSQAEDRSCVGACLQQFRAEASDASRKALWALAHEKWSVWSFGGKDRLMQICCSEIDYALVGHALENLTADERSAVIEANLSRVTRLEAEWHASFTSLLDVRNRHLSQIQPFLVAEQGLNGAWLSDSPLLPEGHAETAYSRHRYSV